MKSSTVIFDTRKAFVNVLASRLAFDIVVHPAEPMRLLYSDMIVANVVKVLLILLILYRS